MPIKREEIINHINRLVLMPKGHQIQFFSIASNKKNKMENKSIFVGPLLSETINFPRGISANSIDLKVSKHLDCKLHQKILCR